MLPPSWDNSWVSLPLHGPMMSFGVSQLDRLGPTDTMPGHSQVTGLLANVLGYQHREGAKINALSRALEMVSLAPVSTRTEVRMVDFQTVDLTRMRLSWSTVHGLSTRDEDDGTILRYREYLCDASRVVLFRLVGDDPSLPSLERVLKALDEPIGIPFLGRVGCPPSLPMVGKVIWARTREEAISEWVKLFGGALVRFEVSAEEASKADRVRSVGDRKVWEGHSAYHVGTRWVQEQIRP